MGGGPEALEASVRDMYPPQGTLSLLLAKSIELDVARCEFKPQLCLS